MVAASRIACKYCEKEFKTNGNCKVHEDGRCPKNKNKRKLYL